MPVHKGITIVLSLFRSHWLAVVYCLVLCSGSYEPVHEDRTERNLNNDTCNRHNIAQYELRRTIGFVLLHVVYFNWQLTPFFLLELCTYLVNGSYISSDLESVT